MEEMLIELFESAPIWVSLLAGILTFFSPCVLPLVPAYLSYISGLSVQELQHDETMSRGQQLKIIRAALMFIFGFGLVFILLGAMMADLVEDVFKYDFVTWIAGGIIITFGLHIMHIINIPFLNLSKQSNFGSTKGVFAPFILGLSFALGWTPCIGPIFAAIVSMAASEGAGQGMMLMVIYTIGLALPFLGAAFVTTRALHFFQRAKQHFGMIEKVSGVLLIIIGIAIATGGLGKLTGLFY